jgi:hypothetical protein
MQAIKPSHMPPARSRERGVAAVEFALVSMVFFLFFFGILEVARAMYICNTLQEVTRRAAATAANTDFSSASSMQHVREQAIFRDSPGFLMFAEPVTDAHIRIDYMRISKVAGNLTMEPIPSGSLPSSPAANYVNCLKDPSGAEPNSAPCIRLVRVRVCLPGGGAECMPVPYKSLTTLVPLPFRLPVSTTIVNAETLGLPEGVPPAPCGC